MRQRFAEYDALVKERNGIISENRSRRMRRGVKQRPLPVPPVPQPPLVAMSYDAQGDFAGMLYNHDDLPEGHTLKWEPANRPPRLQ